MAQPRLKPEPVWDTDLTGLTPLHTNTAPQKWHSCDDYCFYRPSSPVLGFLFIVLLFLPHLLSLVTVLPLLFSPLIVARTASFLTLAKPIVSSSLSTLSSACHPTQLTLPTVPSYFVTAILTVLMNKLL